MTTEQIRLEVSRIYAEIKGKELEIESLRTKIRDFQSKCSHSNTTIVGWDNAHTVCTDCDKDNP